MVLDHRVSPSYEQGGSRLHGVCVVRSASRIDVRIWLVETEEPATGAGLELTSGCRLLMSKPVTQSASIGSLAAIFRAGAEECRAAAGSRMGPSKAPEGHRTRR